MLVGNGALVGYRVEFGSRRWIEGAVRKAIRQVREVRIQDLVFWWVWLLFSACIQILVGV